MKSLLTKMNELTRIVLVGETDAGSAEVQPVRDSQLKATNCRWGGSLTPAIPFYEQGQFRALLCLKKPPAEGRYCLLSIKWICPFHAEPVQFLRSQLGYLQIQRCVRGITSHIYEVDIKANILVPLPPDKLISEISELSVEKEKIKMGIKKSIKEKK